MSYAGISVREALDKLNAPNNGWYLPQVQRKYVWGERHESEDYVCLLLDSLLKRYPIGGVVLWETKQKVPYRWFVQDYVPGQHARQVDEGTWSAPAIKALVYDGQQRLQTLYSVLRHRFNGRALHFDLLFDPITAESDETGFLFRNADVAAEPRYLRMTELSNTPCNADEKVDLEDRALQAAGNDKSVKLRVRRNLSALWDIFVDTNHKSIAYFSVKADSPAEVNEVFRRLNTGGMALTQLDLVLGKIKAVQSDYEEKLWALSEDIAKQSGGIEFSSTSILQFFHLLIKNTIRIDEGRLDGNDIQAFQSALDSDREPLLEVFRGYLQGLLNINHASIVPRWLAVLPIAAYLTELKRHGHEWRIRTWDESEVQLIHQYFLLSQLCDWNTQTMVNAFAREAMEAGRQNWSFPLDAIRKIAVEKNRTGELNEYQLLSQAWLAAKVLMPSRSYVFHDNKPQVDHIFPMRLAGHDEAYQEAVDVLWNFQPKPAEINRYKSNRHPKEFFQSLDGSKYWGSYDFIPAPKDPLWDEPPAFVAWRKQQMLAALENLYGLKVASTADDASSSQAIASSLNAKLLPKPPEQAEIEENTIKADSDANQRVMQSDTEPRPATKDDWDNLQEMPARRATLTLDLTLNEGEAAAIRRGLIPEEMEEKWFAYFADQTLYLHRSWTGYCIDQIHFIEHDDGLRVTHAEVNRDPVQYSCIDDAEDIQRIKEMVLGLAQRN